MGLEKVDDFKADAPPPLAIAEDLNKVAKTFNEFQNMILSARMQSKGSDAYIECTKEVAQFLLKQSYNPEVGYFIYQDVFVFEEGRREEIMEKMRMTMDKKIFGHSKIKEIPIPDKVERDPRGNRD